MTHGGQRLWQVGAIPIIDVVSPSAAQRNRILLSELQGMVPVLLVGAAVLQNGAG